jgi:protein TonB
MREAAIWGMAVAGSLLLHGALVWHSENRFGEQQAVTRTKLASVSVALNTAAQPQQKKSRPRPTPKPPLVPTPAKEAKAPPPQKPPVPESSKPVAESAASKALRAGARRTYLEALVRHINRHKVYPASAMRRRIEGDVKVKFVVETAGHLKRLNVHGGALVLQDAARQAVRDSVPLPEPPDGVLLPLKVEYVMEFVIR